MWFKGEKEIPHYEIFKLKSVKINASWHDVFVPPGSPLSVHPLHFIYASTRASILGGKIGLRGQLAGLGLGSSALCYLTPSKAGKSYTPTTRLFLHNNFKYAKDFVGSSIKGTIGASLAYLEMQRMGYAWSGHWEDCAPSTHVPIIPPTKKAKATTKKSSTTPKASTPDFIFASSSEICLVDAKGSSRALDEVRSFTKGEWKRQIYPNRRVNLIGGGAPTEGRIISSALKHPQGVGVISAHGYFRSQKTTSESKKIKGFEGSLKAVQKVNYTNAFYLLGLNRMAEQLRGKGDDSAWKQLSWALSQAKEVDGSGKVFSGPMRVVDLGRQGAWLMQPFCRIDTLENAFTSLSDGESSPLPTTDLLFPEKTEKLSDAAGSKLQGTERMVVQSHDGVGAIFQRVDI